MDRSENYDNFLDKEISSKIGTIAIIINNSESIGKVNNLLSEYSEIVIARMGLPLRDRGFFVISLIVDGNNDKIGALTGKLGRINGVNVKSMLTKG